MRGQIRQDIDWDKQPFGHESDKRIADRLRCHESTVWYHRHARGIESYGRSQANHRKSPVIDWDEQPLGEMPDTALAERLKTEQQYVQSARARRGIPAYGTTVEPQKCYCGATFRQRNREHRFCSDVCRWSTAGHEDVPELWPMLRELRLFLRDRRALLFSVDWDSVPWETVTDREIAAVVGCSPSVVGKRRRALGIPAWEERKTNVEDNE